MRGKFNLNAILEERIIPGRVLYHFRHGKSTKEITALLHEEGYPVARQRVSKIITARFGASISGRASTTRTGYFDSEYMPDDGCNLAPSCLSCPLPKCKHDRKSM